MFLFCILSVFLILHNSKCMYVFVHMCLNLLGDRHWGEWYLIHMLCMCLCLYLCMHLDVHACMWVQFLFLPVCMYMWKSECATGGSEKWLKKGWIARVHSCPGKWSFSLSPHPNQVWVLHHLLSSSTHDLFLRKKWSCLYFSVYYYWWLAFWCNYSIIFIEYCALYIYIYFNQETLLCLIHCSDILSNKEVNKSFNNLFSIPEIHQSGYRTCH